MVCLPEPANNQNKARALANDIQWILGDIVVEENRPLGVRGVDRCVGT